MGKQTKRKAKKKNKQNQSLNHLLENGKFFLEHSNWNSDERRSIQSLPTTTFGGFVCECMETETDVNVLIQDHETYFPVITSSCVQCF